MRVFHVLCKIIRMSVLVCFLYVSGLISLCMCYECTCVCLIERPRDIERMSRETDVLMNLLLTYWSIFTANNHDWFWEIHLQWMWIASRKFAFTNSQVVFFKINEIVSRRNKYQPIDISYLLISQVTDTILICFVLNIYIQVAHVPYVQSVLTHEIN